MNEKVLPPVLPGLPRLRPGKTVADALSYAGVEMRPGMTMDDVRQAVTAHAAASDPRRRPRGDGPQITTVEQAEAAINHWATAPYEGCGNYGLGMTVCEAVNLNGDCPRTKYCFAAEPTREAVGKDRWDRNGWATDDEATSEGIEDLLCPYWDPDDARLRDNTDEWLLPVGEAEALP